MDTVTIIIPTRNRLPVLLNTLAHLRELDSPRPQVIVYDDASDLDPAETLRRSFPQQNFVFLRTDKPLGPCELRNRMMREASGEYVIGLDDDSYLMGQEDYRRAIHAIAGLPDAALIGLEIVLSDGIQYPKLRRSGHWPVASFLGCGFIARKNVLLEVGGFDSFFVRAGEERDLAIRLIDQGWKLYASLDSRVFHERTLLNRDHQLIEGLAFRNSLFFYLKHFSGIRLWIYLLQSFLIHSVICLMHGWRRAYAFGIGDFFKHLGTVLKMRTPVRLEVMKEYLKLKRRT